MFTIISLWRTKLASRISTKFVLAATALLLGSASASADTACRTVNGHFNIIPVSGPDCPSSVGVCGRGTFLGGILGDYFSPFTSIVATAETPTTGVVLYTADITVTNAQVGEWAGDLLLKESGAYHTVGKGEFAALFSLVGGTGSFANANGVLSSTGTAPAGTTGEGVYSGQICVP
jgi:hypothetical protein